MRYRLSAVGLAVLLVLSACGVVSGSGQVATETRSVSGFTAIDLAGAGEVTLEQGDAESLTIEADDNVLPRLTSEVSGSTLKLDKKPGITVNTKNPIRYRVTVQNLTGVGVSGSGSVRAQDMTIQALQVDISGSGTVDFTGSAVEQNIEVSGSGRFEAAELQSEKVTADISGSGQVAVAVSRELRVDISGSGTVTYFGDPNVQQSISGSGRVIKK
jgi:Putative auto-transporter adhesin, head GIN domain